MITVTLAVLALFSLLVFVAVRWSPERGVARPALGAAIGLALLAGVFSIVGARRWDGCRKVAGGRTIKTHGTFGKPGFGVDDCPAPLLGIRDPF